VLLMSHNILSEVLRQEFAASSKQCGRSRDKWSWLIVEVGLLPNILLERL
jgi:hypothetical protein